MNEEECPAYTALREGLNQKSMGPANIPVGEGQSERDHDVLEMIKHGRYSSTLSDGDLVQSLASQGHAIETVADALDKSVEEVEALADKERMKLAAKLESTDGN